MARRPQPKILEAEPELQPRPEIDAELEQRLVDLISEAGETDWRAAAWLLEHGRPGRWARRTARPAAAVIVADEPDPFADDPDPFAEIDELATKRRRRR